MLIFTRVADFTPGSVYQIIMIHESSLKYSSQCHIFFFWGGVSLFPLMATVFVAEKKCMQPLTRCLCLEWIIIILLWVHLNLWGHILFYPENIYIFPRSGFFLKDHLTFFWEWGTSPTFSFSMMVASLSTWDWGATITALAHNGWDSFSRSLFLKKLSHSMWVRFPMLWAFTPQIIFQRQIIVHVYIR